MLAVGSAFTTKSGWISLFGSFVFLFRLRASRDPREFIRYSGKRVTPVAEEFD